MRIRNTVGIGLVAVLCVASLSVGFGAGFFDGGANQPTANTVPELSLGLLQNAASKAVLTSSLGVSSAGPRADRSGISVTLFDRHRRNFSIVQAHLEKALGVPVFILNEDGPTPISN